MHAPPAMVPHISLPASSDALPTAIACSAPVLREVPSSASIASASMSVTSAPTMARQVSPDPATINHQSSAPKLAACNTSPRGPTIALLSEHLVLRDAEFAELDEAFITRKNRVLQLESTLSTAASTEAMLCSQVATVQTDLCSARDSLTIARSSGDSATLALKVMRSDNERLESQVSELSATVNDMRFKLATAQPSIPSASFESL